MGVVAWDDVGDEDEDEDEDFRQKGYPDSDNSDLGL